MMGDPKPSKFLASLVAQAVLLLAFANGTVEAQQPSDEAALSWVLENYKASVDAILPPSLDEWRVGDGWRASVRIVPTDGMEFHGLIEKPFGPVPVRATIKRPLLISIWRQLFEAKIREPGLTLQEAVRIAAVQRNEVSEKDCPVLVDLVEELEELKTDAVPPNLLVMDCTEFRFDIQTAYGSRLSFAFCGPQSGTPAAPLSIWASRVRETLEGCIRRR